MNKQRLAILIAAGVGLLATFLPFMSFGIISASGFKLALRVLDGYATDPGYLGITNIVFFAIPFIISLTGNRQEVLKGRARIVSVVFAGIQSLFCLLFASDAGSMTEIGVYLALLAGIAVIILAFVIKDKPQTDGITN